MENTISWLLKSESWVRYKTRIDLLGLSEYNAECIRDYDAVLTHPNVKSLLQDIEKWPGKPLIRHNDATLNIHKLTFLTDIGIRKDEPQVAKVVEMILSNPSKEGPFQVIINIPTHVGGSGKDENHWMLCDTPILQYALIQLGFEDNPRVIKAMEHLIRLVRKNGWPCAGSSTMSPGFKGPGNKEDPCPYSTLVMLKTLAKSIKWKDSEATRYGVESLLDLWQHSYEKSPYLFKMGNDFRKLKAPLIWYDLLHLTEVLSQFEWIYNDPRFLEIINLLSTKADENNRYTADSVWMEWKEWEFGQKKDPSGWLTFLVLRILKRVGLVNIDKEANIMEF